MLKKYDDSEHGRPSAFPNYRELRLHRLEPHEVKATFLATSDLRWLLRTLPLKLRWHVVNWKIQVDLGKVVVGEPTLQPVVEPLSVDELPLHLPKAHQHMTQHYGHLRLNEAAMNFRVYSSLTALWIAHQEHYTFTLRSKSGYHLMTVTTPAYTHGGFGYFFSK
jgi:hypothetical protein